MASQLPGGSNGPTQRAEIPGPDDLVIHIDPDGRVIVSRGAWEIATLNDASPFAPDWGASWMATPTPPDLPQLMYRLVANGNSAGEAFELQVMDPSGVFKKVIMPDGLVLEPGAKKPPQDKQDQPPGDIGKMLTQKITAFCLQFAKLPPEAGMLYKIADAAKQKQYQPVGKVLQAGYELGANGELNPDSDPKAYIDFIRQYAAWAFQEHWNEQQFTEQWIERTKKNAQAMKIAWSNQMENALRAAAPNRWRDITKVLNKAESTQ
jgi:hypothetical protein